MFDVNTNCVSLTIKSLPPMKVYVGGGIEALPTITFMSQRDRKGPPCWWGIHVKEVHCRDWVTESNLEIYTQMLMGLEHFGHHPHSDLVRVVNNFMDLQRGKKKPVIYGNDDKDLLQAHFGNGCCIDVYRDPAALNQAAEYGGYEGHIDLFGQERTFFLYHRGVSLYNYLDKSKVRSTVATHLQRLFPEIFDHELIPVVLRKHGRIRGK